MPSASPPGYRAGRCPRCCSSRSRESRERNYLRDESPSGSLHTAPNCLHNHAAVARHKGAIFQKPIITMAVLPATAREKKSHTIVLSCTVLIADRQGKQLLGNFNHLLQLILGLLLGRCESLVETEETEQEQSDGHERETMYSVNSPTRGRGVVTHPQKRSRKETSR